MHGTGTLWYLVPCENGLAETTVAEGGQNLVASYSPLKGFVVPACKVEHFLECCSIFWECPQIVYLRLIGTETHLA